MKGPKHLRGLSPDQREGYRLYRRKGFSIKESLAAVKAAPCRFGSETTPDAGRFFAAQRLNPGVPGAGTANGEVAP